MAVALSELEGSPELEAEYEYESEFEYGGELEGEQFLRQIIGLARRAARSPTLRRVGLAAARSALGGLGNVGGAIGGAPGSRGAAIGSGIGSSIGTYLGGRLPTREFESEWELESELNPIRRVYPDALMEHLGHAAAEAETEAEAEAFIGALIPLAARLIPRVAPMIMRAAPNLIRGVSRATRVLRANPATRPLVRAIPTVVRRTAADIARQAARGQPVTPRGAVRSLARQTARVLTSPRQCARAMQRSAVVDRQYHRAPAAAARAAAPCACQAR
jgi:hypothetical protein